MLRCLAGGSDSPLPWMTMKDQQKSKRQLVEELVRLRLQCSGKRQTPLEGGVPGLSGKVVGPQENTMSTWAMDQSDSDIFDAVPDALIIVEEDGAIMTANPSAGKMYGYSDEEFRARRITDLLHGGANDLYPHLKRTIEKRGAYKSESLAVRADGSTFAVEMRGTHVHLRGRLSLMIIIRDITKRRQANQLLREREQLYRSLFENNYSVILLIAADTAEIYDANPAACAYYGYSRKTLRTMKITDINVLSALEVQEEMENALHERRSYFNFRHRLADDTVRDVEVFSGPITVGGKSLLCSIIHDISRRRAEEKEREELIDQLQKTLSEVRALRGILPICSCCKKIRDDRGYWEQVEEYIAKYIEVQFSHGLCEECAEQMYGGETWFQEIRDKKE